MEQTTEVNFLESIKIMLKKDGREELERLASVSVYHECECGGECFCCYVFNWLQTHKEEK